MCTRAGGVLAAAGGLAQAAVGGAVVAAPGIGTVISGGVAAPRAIPAGLFVACVAAHGLNHAEVDPGFRAP